MFKLNFKISKEGGIMDENLMKLYKKKLLSEKEEVKRIIKNLRDNDMVYTNIEMSSEISHYDNHPADTASEIYTMETGIALKVREDKIYSQIESSLNDIEKGTYGKCKYCGNEISKERLDFIPYAEYCIECQKKINSKTTEIERPVEEKVLGNPFYFDHANRKEEIVDGTTDNYQDVYNYNKIDDYYSIDNSDNIYNDDDEYVDPIEKISNAQYKASLPD